MGGVQNTILFYLLFFTGFGSLIWWHHKSKKRLLPEEKKIIRDYANKSLGKLFMFLVGVNLLSLFVKEVTGSFELSTGFLFLITGIFIVFIYQKKHRAFSNLKLSERFLKTDRHIAYLMVLFFTLFGTILFLF